MKYIKYKKLQKKIKAKKKFKEVLAYFTKI